jgi:hypothetical protein
MRFLPNARIVVLDGDGRRRALICAELVELGLTQVVPAGSARRRNSSLPISRLICASSIRARSAPTPGPKFSPTLFTATEHWRSCSPPTPRWRRWKRPLRPATRAVIGLPVVPRMLYRRMGSVLQKVRRTARRAS